MLAYPVTLCLSLWKGSRREKGFTMHFIMYAWVHEILPFFERKFMDSMPDLLWLDTYFTHRSTSRRTFFDWQVWYPHECNEAIFFFYINICVRKLVHLLKIIFGIFSQTVCQAARQQGQFPLCLLNIISTVRLHNIACSDTDIFLSHA